MKCGEGETIIRSINNKSNQEETRRKKQVDIADTRKIEEQMWKEAMPVKRKIII